MDFMGPKKAAETGSGSPTTLLHLLKDGVRNLPPRILAFFFWCAGWSQKKLRKEEGGTPDPPPPPGIERRLQDTPFPYLRSRETLGVCVCG